METSLPENINFNQHCVIVCQYRSCLANGSADVLAAFQAMNESDLTIEGTGCQGQCSSGPTVRILPEETWYCRVQTTDVPLIVESLKAGKQLEHKLNRRIHIRFY